MDAVVARMVIKDYLRQKGQQSIGFDLTPAYVLLWWRVFNVAIFDNQLNLPHRIICRNFRDNSYGWCDSWDNSDKVEIGIRRQLKNNRLFLNVLAHEMVHQAQWEIYGEHERHDHGKTFFAWKPLLKTHTGLCLRRWYD